MEDYQGEYYIIHESRGRTFRKWFLRISALILLLTIIGGTFYWFFQPKIDIEISQDEISVGSLLSVKASTWFVDNIVWEIGDTLIRDKEEIALEISQEQLSEKPYLYVVLKATGRRGEEFIVSKSLKVIHNSPLTSQVKQETAPLLVEGTDQVENDTLELVAGNEDIDEFEENENVADKVAEEIDFTQEEPLEIAEEKINISLEEVKSERKNAERENDKVELLAKALLAGSKKEKENSHITKAAENNFYTWPNLNGWTLAEKANLLSDKHYNIDDREGLFYQIIEEFDVLDAHIHVMGNKGKVAKEFRPAPYFRQLLDGKDVAIRIRKANYNNEGLITLWQVGEVRR